MDITKIAAAGGFGYVFGLVVKTNPKIVALCWLVAETAVQIFRQVYGFRHENSVRLVAAGIACIYLNDQHLFPKTVHAILGLVSFCLVPEILTHLNIKYTI